MNRDRYLRQALVQGLDPARLQAMRIAVVGAGAVGNEVVKNLALMGVGAVDVHDFDRVELHNLTRSIFLRESDVGTAKAAAVVARAAEVDPQVKLTAVTGDAWRTLTLRHVAACTALIACVDNLEARMKLSQLCLLAGVRFIHCGIDARSVTVETMPFDAAELPACYECHLPSGAYERVAERYSCGWLRRALQAERVVPTTAITASVAGALAVQAALAPRDDDRPAVARRVFFDTRSGHASTAELPRNPACAACADFARRPRRVAARGGWFEALQQHAADADAVRLSDALIFDHACRLCGDTSQAARFIGHRADEFDDDIVRCAHCGQHAVHVEIHAEVAVDDLAQRLGRDALPLKFLLAHDAAGADWTCIDLEDTIP